MEAKLNIRKNAKCYYVRLSWYDADGKVIDNDIVRINLSNADCHLALAPYYG